MKQRNVFAIGDIHGVPWALESALSDAKDLGAIVVLVGDYINRGPDSKGVLDMLCEAKASFNERLVLLRGNHEHSLLKFLTDGESGDFVSHGGLSTILSYVGTEQADPIDYFRRTFPVRHRELLEATALYFETDDLLISHAGFNPENPSSRTIEDMTLGSFWELFNPSVESAKDLVVCGHYVQTTGEPYVSDHFVCLDSGCGSQPGAPLTAMLVQHRTIWHYEGTLDDGHRHRPPRTPRGSQAW